MSEHRKELGQRMRSGAIWTYIQGWSNTIIQFLAGIILARLLEPADFGVFFAVTAYTAILAAQVRFGIAQALLQAKDLHQEQWNSAFWMMEAIAVLLTIVVFSAADSLGSFYSDPRYSEIIKLMCITFFLMPFMSINGTLLQKRMDFKTVSQINIKAGLSGIVVSLLAAYFGYGPYSLVMGGITGAFVSTILMAIKAPWLPRLSFSLEMLRPLFKFGWRFHLNNSLSMLTKRIDNMMIGRMLDIAALGLYARAFNLANMPVANICSPLYQLLFSGFSKIQDNLEHSVLMYRKAICAISSAVYPLLLLLIFAGDDFIYFVYGEKWLPAALPMKILAVGFFAQVLSITTSSFGAAQNLVAKQTPIVLTNLTLTVIAVAVGINWGLEGVATGIAIKMYLILILVFKMMGRSHIKLRLRDVYSSVLPAAVSSCFTAAVCLTIDYILRTHYAITPLMFMHMVLMIFFVLLAFSASWITQAYLFTGNIPLQTNMDLLRDILRRTARFIVKAD